MIHEEGLREIVALLEEKGYNPVAQLIGYIELGNDNYITRHGGARDKIKEIDISVIKEYIENQKTS